LKRATENNNTNHSQRERHAYKKRSYPTYDSGALLANWTMLTLSAD